MKCLHICNDLLGSRVHFNLYKALSEEADFDHRVFYPVRKETAGKIGTAQEEYPFEIVASGPLKNYHRFLFRAKVNYLYNDLSQKMDLSTVGVAHATTLFSDGAIAYKLYKQYRTPYVLAIRGTDINIFFKFRKDLYFLMRNILLNASKIVFISASLEQNFFSHPMVKGLAAKLRPKSMVIPNGIDDYWLQRIEIPGKQIPSNMLYIGKFNRNKNVIPLIKAVLELKEELGIHLNIIGKGGNEEGQIKQYAVDYPGSISFHGPVFEKEELRRAFTSNHIFGMVSLGETFGLVYVEALSQGLPILYTRNQGIDGTFKERVGEAVNPRSVESIKEGLRTLVQDYNSYEIAKVDFSRFSWSSITRTYSKLYEEALFQR